MKKTAINLFFATLSALFLTQNVSGETVYKSTESGMEVLTGNGLVKIDFYTPSSVRVAKSPRDTMFLKNSLAVTAEPIKLKNKISTRDDNKIVEMDLGNFIVAVNTDNASVQFLNPDRTVILTEKGGPEYSPFKDGDRDSYTVAQTFFLPEDEDIYGLGNLENGQLSQRGISTTLMPGNIEDGIPLFVSTNGYGIYWDNYAPTKFSDTKEGTRLESSPGEGVDYYFMKGDDMDGVVKEIRALTGDVPMFPLWTYGFWQSRERYKSSDELLSVVDGYRKNRIPLDGIIQDWQYWGNNYLWNAMEFMNEEFPDPKAMVDSVHNSNAHIIISIWSSFGPMTKQYKELDKEGLLFNISTWPQSGISHIWPPRMDYPSGVRVYDAYSPRARDIYWNHLLRLKNLGIDGWWMDSTEPDHFDVTEQDFLTPTHLGTFRSVRGAYPLMAVGGVSQHQMKDFPDERVFILTRSGWAGQQRYGCNVWSGDVGSSWDALRKQIPAGLNFTLTGNPNFNSDLGGFFAGRYNRKGMKAVDNPAFHELYVRWTQFGALCPMMRSHGTDVPREIYLYGESGEPVYDALVNAVKLRYSLLPYIYSTSWKVTSDGSSFMRALPMDFPDDRNVRNINDEYMFGENILVSPVVNPQYTPENPKDLTPELAKTIDFTKPAKSKVYLPKYEGKNGNGIWWDFYDNRSYTGGDEIEITTQFDRIPLYLKGGTILPVGPDVEWAEEKSWDALDIRVFPGADGHFDLYEDEFNNNNYLNGAYSVIPFSWDEKSQRLTIGKREGSYNGMPEKRIFRVQLPDGKVKSIEYNGKKTSQKF